MTNIIGPLSYTYLIFISVSRLEVFLFVCSMVGSLLDFDLALPDRNLAVVLILVRCVHSMHS